MRNLMSVVFGLLKMSFWVSKKGQLSFSEGRYGLRHTATSLRKLSNHSSDSARQIIAL